MKIEIKSVVGSTLFSHEALDNTISITLEKAVASGINLAGANLAGADLRGANLRGANLASADLRDANLGGSNLRFADLVDANLARSELWSANLVKANLAGANLANSWLASALLLWTKLAGAFLDNGEVLIGERPILQIGPIGSRSSYLVSYITDQGLRLRTGRFFGSKEEFLFKVGGTHGHTDYAREYLAALAMIEVHAEIWTPK